MAEEGAAEKVYEAGLELVNPGGQPEVLEAAADAWRALGTHLDKFVVHMDGKIRAVHGTEWRGPAADAFMEHWREVKKSVEDSQETFTDAAKGLDDAAESIKKVNAEIHQIYLEIGVTVAAGLATSFITMGFGAAASAANAARLAGQATAAAARLGRLLAGIARVFHRLYSLRYVGKAAPWVLRGGIEYGANVATSVASGKGTEWDKNIANAAFGMAGGAAAGKLLGGMGEGMAKSVSEGALGGALGSVGGDTANNIMMEGEEFDASQMLIGAAGGAVGGGAGGGLKHHAMDNLMPDSTPTPGTPTPDGSPTPGTSTPDSSSAPRISLPDGSAVPGFPAPDATPTPGTSTPDTTPTPGTGTDGASGTPGGSSSNGSGTGSSDNSSGTSGSDGTNGSSGSGSGTAEGSRPDDFYGDAADAGLGKPAGIVAGEEFNDYKDMDENAAKNSENAQTANRHAANTSLKGDFG